MTDIYRFIFNFIKFYEVGNAVKGSRIQNGVGTSRLRAPLSHEDHEDFSSLEPFFVSLLFLGMSKVARFILAFTG